jgi:pimeloyl-ACP methyl ester carboxylesterase
MDPHNIEEWELVAAGVGFPEVERRVSLMRTWVLDDPASVFSDLTLPPPDLAALAERAAFAVRRGSLIEGLTTPFGWYDDDVAFFKPWGFAVEEVTVPVDLRYGWADVFVPESHGEWLAAALPHATVVVDDLGHLGGGDVLAGYRSFVMACRL